MSDVLAKQLDEAEFGPNIEFREYSFLNNTMVSGSSSSSRAAERQQHSPSGSQL